VRFPTMTILALLAVAPASAALAQTVARAGRPPVRAVAAANGGWQTASRTFADAFTFERYVETATVEAAYRVRSGPLYEGGASVRLWRWVGAGVTVSSFTDRTEARVTGSIPHPFFFDRARALDGRAPVTHRETSVHGQVAVFVPVGARLLLVAGGGPSVVSVEQSFVTSVDYDEAYPYDTVTFRRAETTRVRARKVGAHVGADLVVRLGTNLGAGLLVRYTQVKVGLEPADGRSIRTEAGGWQAGAGFRVLF
jgi:hypothetical protein